jgi:CheY-like chemotaxis protein
VEHFMPDATQRAAGKTVLVVDDHDATRQTIARMLEAGGFPVRTASNGAEALERLARESGEIDLVLSDVTMPGMTGIDFIVSDSRAVSRPAGGDRLRRRE